MDQQSNQTDTETSADGMADALSAVAIVIIPVVAVVIGCQGCRPSTPVSQSLEPMR